MEIQIQSWRSVIIIVKYAVSVIIFNIPLLIKNKILKQ